MIKGKPRPHWGTDQTLQLHAILDEDWEKLRGPVVLKLRFVFENLDPRGSTPIVEVGLPGLVRGALDQLCGLAWENEKQLVAIHAAKEYGNVNGTFVTF